MRKGFRFLFLTGLCLCSLVVYAQNINEQTRQRQEIEKQIGLIDNQLTTNKNKQQSELKSLELLQQKISSRKELLSHFEEQIKQLNDSIKRNEGKIKVLTAEYDKLESSYLNMLYRAYTHRNRQVWAAYILASDNLKQGYRRWQYYKNYSQYLNRQAAEMKLTNASLNQESSRLRQLRAEIEGLKEEEQKALATLNQDELQSKQIVTNLSRKKQELETQLKQKQKELDAINKELARIMAQAEKGRTTASAKDAEANRQLATNFEQNKGRLPWPIQGVVTEPYGQRNHPVLKGIKMPFNNGIGILGSRGDEVRAVFQGVVKRVYFQPGYNQCVLIQHGSYYTFYCRLESVKIKIGDTVATGDVLGTLAEIDGEFSLHFEVWKGMGSQNPAGQNPEQWLRKR